MNPMKIFLSCMLMFFYVTILFAQNALITEKKIMLKTYPFSEPDPVPEFGKIYPYFHFDGYEKEGIMREWKMIEMENDYIKLWVTSEMGGKIWGAVEKSTGREFIYYNHVVKFRNVAMRGPWTSGGIEINFGVIGHAPTTSSPVDYFLRKNDDGSVSCFVSATDLPSRTRWTVEVNLPADKAWFTTNVVWDNPTPMEQSYYHWMNMGIKTKGNLEYIFPGDNYIGHDGDKNAWPADEKGREISFYEKNNFGGPKSYHVLGEATGFYGAYWHDDDFGFAHYSGFDEKPGKKIWIWGLSDHGMIWERLLTDTDGQYSEVQSGRTFNQAASRSNYTPFKNKGFNPGSTDQWTEFWFPVKGTKGLKFATAAGSVNMEQKGNLVNLWFCPNEIVSGKLEVRNGKEIVYLMKLDSKPMESIAGSFEYAGNYKNLSVWLNGELFYETDRDKYLIKRPVESPEGFNWETGYGHFLKGREYEKQRLYKQAEAEFRRSLDIDSWYVPALTGLARMEYRKAEYATSMEFSLKALSVDTYDAGANMMYGLSGLALGDTVSAIDGFSIASQDISFRSTACNELASINIRKRDYRKALEYAEQSISFNNPGSEGIQLKILCLRKLGWQKDIDNELIKLEKNDPLNHFVRFERYIRDPSDENRNLVKNHIFNELPQETYLEYALWYFRNGQKPETLQILELAPEDHPVVVLWKSYLHYLSGNEKRASEALAKAMNLKPDLVFPFRKETLEPLNWAETWSDDWKIKYYKGLIYLGTGASGKGRELWESCRQQPDYYPFYFARAALYEPGSSQAQTDVARALELGGDNWRAGWNAVRYYLDLSDSRKAEELAVKYYQKYPGNFNMGLLYAKVLEVNKKYSLCLGVLRKIEVLPGEGAAESRTIWRNANLGYARELMDAGKYRKAIVYIDQAREWPVNLGVGKPYNPDERREDELAEECYLKINGSRNAF
jgi:tetratricopeptide (TPR) repeat protein